MKVIKLYPTFPFHYRVGIGRMDEVDETIHSDTLFSALINCADMLYGDSEVNALIEAFNEGRFNISSVFFGITTSLGETLFLPKPYGHFSPSNKENHDSPKKIKKIRYISLDIWKKIVSSWDKEKKIFNYDLTSHEVVGEKFLLSEKNEELLELDFIKSISRPKVSINRSNNAAENFYFQTEIELISTKEAQPFLFFLFRGNIDKKIKAIFNLLIEEGIGGKRFLGKGTFRKWDVGEIDLPDADNEGYNVSLSLVMPNKNEVDGIESYNLIRRDGFIYSNGGTSIRKKAVRLLSEGAIFNNNVKGRLFDAKPDTEKINHPVYVNGKSFNIKLGE